jgi:hypothetical protein
MEAREQPYGPCDGVGRDERCASAIGGAWKRMQAMQVRVRDVAEAAVLVWCDLSWVGSLKTGLGRAVASCSSQTGDEYRSE